MAQHLHKAKQQYNDTTSIDHLLMRLASPKMLDPIMKTFTIAMISSLLILTSALSPPYEPPCDTCVPTPDKNKCDITTSCTYVWGHDNPHTPGPNYCACRHGYRMSLATTITAPSSAIQHISGDGIY